MIRNLILSAVVAASAAGAASAQPPAGPYYPQPGPHYPHHPVHHTRYVVEVRHHHGHWCRYETFTCYEDARRAVWCLEREGRCARIETVHGW